jgi:hypothetical protein
MVEQDMTDAEIVPDPFAVGENARPCYTIFGRATGISAPLRKRSVPSAL